MSTLRSRRSSDYSYWRALRQRQLQAKGKQRAPSFQLEPLEPRLLLAATPADVTNTTVQSQLVELFVKADSLGEDISNDAASNEKAGLVGLSANEMLQTAAGDTVESGDFLQGFDAALSSYFATDATPTTPELVAALNDHANAILGTTGKSLVTGTLNGSNLLTLNFNFDTTDTAGTGIGEQDFTRNVDVSLGDAALDLSLVIEDGTQVELEADARVRFSATADLSDATLVESDARYALNVTDYRIRGTIDTAAPDNLDFGMQIGSLGGKGMSDLVSLVGDGAWVDNATIDFDMELMAAFGNPDGDALGSLTLDELDGLFAEIADDTTIGFVAAATPVSGATTIAFYDGPSEIRSTLQFKLNGGNADTIEATGSTPDFQNYVAGMQLRVTGAGTNDGTYTITAATNRKITLSDGDLSAQGNVTTPVRLEALNGVITDSANGLGSIVAGIEIIVTGSTANNGTYTVAQVTSGAILLDPSASLTTEAAGAAVTLAHHAAIVDQTARLASAGFISGQRVAVTGSLLNDGAYEVGTVLAGALMLAPAESLNTEAAGTTLTLVGTDRVALDHPAAYTSNTIGFSTTGTHQITDSAAKFLEAGFKPGQIIQIRGSASNNKLFTIAAVTDSTIELTTNGLNAAPSGATVTLMTVAALPIAFTTSRTIGDFANSISVELPVKVDVSQVGGVDIFGGLSGIVGNIKLGDFDVGDGLDPFIRTTSTGIDVFRNFGRVLPRDMLGLITDFTLWAELFQQSDAFGADMPFLDADLGDAYDFAALFRTQLEAQLSYDEYYVTGTTAPSTLTGSHSFQISVNGTAPVTVNLVADAGRTSLGDLLTDLNTALPPTVQARLFASDPSRIELYSVGPEDLFVLTGLNDAGDTLDLGLASYNQLITQPANDIAATLIPGVVVSSSGAIADFDFSASSTAFDLSYVTAAGSTTALVTLAAFDYEDLEGLRLAVRDSLIQAGALTEADAVFGTPEQGVTVRTNATGGLDFVALETVHRIVLDDVGAHGDSLGRLNISDGSDSTAGSFLVSVNGDPGVRVYFNGNVTDGTIGPENVSVADGGISMLTAELHDAMMRYGALDIDAQTGIDVRASGNTLEFFALNPGENPFDIQSFELSDVSTILRNRLGFGTPTPSTLSAQQFVISQQQNLPRFNTVQELAARLEDPNQDGDTSDSLLNGALRPQYTAVSQEVLFPLQLSLTTLPDLADVALDVGTTAGVLTNIESDSTADISREVYASVDFGFLMNSPGTTLEALSVTASEGYATPAGYDQTQPVGVMIALNSWDAVLSSDAVFNISLDDGVEHTITITAASTALNTDLTDLVTLINAEIEAEAGLMDGANAMVVVDIDNALEGTATANRLRFSTDPAHTDSRNLRVTTPFQFETIESNAARAVLNFDETATDGAGTPTPRIEGAPVGGATAVNGQLTEDAVFVIDYQLGAPTTVTVEASETSGNTSLADLVDDINRAIRRRALLNKPGSTFDDQIVQAYLSTTSIGLRINQDSGVTTANSISVSTPETYERVTLNSAYSELGFTNGEAIAQSELEELGVVSSNVDALGASSFTLSGGARFAVSFDGGAFEDVDIAGAAYGSLAGLLAAINTAINSTATLAGNIKAVRFSASDQIALRVTNDAINSMRFKALETEPGMNVAVDELGFSDDLVFSIRQGGTLFVEDVLLEGLAEVTAAPISLDANLGLVGFRSGAGSTLDVTAHAQVAIKDSTQNTRFTVAEMGQKLLDGQGDDIMFISSTQSGISTFTTAAPSVHGVSAISSANLHLDNLVLAEVGDADPNTESITGLAFGSNPAIDIALEYIDQTETLQLFDLNQINTYTPTYSDLGTADKFTRLAFADIVDSLYASADFLSDFMYHTRPGVSGTVFNQKLPFTESTLLDLVDYGALFRSAVDSVAGSELASLQHLDYVLESGLGLVGKVDLAVVNRAGEISLDINIDWQKTSSDTLPLYMDLNVLGNAFGNAPLLEQDLGFSAIATGYDKELVTIKTLGLLNLDLGIKVYDSGERISPTAMLYDSTQLDVLVSLEANNMSFEIALGPASVKVRNGFAVINADGRIPGVDLNGVISEMDPTAFNPELNQDVTQQARVAAVNAIAGDYVNAGGGGVGDKIRGRVNGDINAVLGGIDGVTDLRLNDRVLVLAQDGDVAGTEAHNGLYVITRAGNAGQAFELTRDTSADSSAELNVLRVAVVAGVVYSDRTFKQKRPVTSVGASAVSFVDLIAPMSMSIDLSGDKVLARTVSAATTGALDASYSSNAASPWLAATLTANGNGYINVSGIDGVTSLEQGEFILVKDQGDTGYNGIYQIRDVGSETTPWVLERAEYADEGAELVNLRVSVKDGSANGGLRFKQTQIQAGIVDPHEFSSILADVVSDFDPINSIYTPWADTPVDGEARAAIPLSVITYIGGTRNELDTGVLQMTINDDRTYTGVASRAGNSYAGMERYLDPTLNMIVGTDPTNHPDDFFTVWFNLPLPQVADSIPKTDVQLLLRDPVMVADSLDLTLFNLQFAMDFATGENLPLVGTRLTEATQYIEAFRVDLTSALRNALRGPVINPITVARNQIWTVLGTDPGGLGFISDAPGTSAGVDRHDVVVTLRDLTNAAMGWDIWADNDSDDDGIDEIPDTAKAIEFSLKLEAQFPEFHFNAIDLGLPGAELDLNAVGNPNYGVTVNTFFSFDFTFGLDLQQGFYVKENPDGDLSTPDIELAFAAQLDADINTPGIQAFNQATFDGTKYDLTVRTRDLLNSPVSFDIGDGVLRGSNSGFYGTFGFNITDGRTSSAPHDANSRLEVTEQYGKRPTQLVTTTLDADSDVNLHMETRHPLAANISLDWHYDRRFGSGVHQGVGLDPFDIASVQLADATWSLNPSSIRSNLNESTGTTSPTGGRPAGATEANVEYVNLSVDLASFMGGVLKPFIDGINSAMKPFQPMIDFLTTEVPVLDVIMGRPVTVIDLAVMFGAVNPAFLLALKGLTVLSGLTDTAVNDINTQRYQSGGGSDAQDPDFLVRLEKSVKVSRLFTMLAKKSVDNRPNSLNNKNRQKGGNNWSNYKKDAKDAKQSSLKGIQKGGDISGGGIYFGIFDPNEAVKLLVGEPADMILFDLPKFTLTLSYELRKNLPPAPVIFAKINFKVDIFFDLGFGWDTEGFYMSDVGVAAGIPGFGAQKPPMEDVPEFGITFTITVGGGVNAAVIEAGVEALFRVTGLIDWNDPNNDGKVRESERELLRALPGGGRNEIDIRVFGEFDLVIYVEVFALFDWVRVFEYNFGPWRVFDETFSGADPVTEPAVQEGDTLYLNIGTRAAGRLFPNVTDGSETVILTSAGVSGGKENITVSMPFLPGTPTKTYNGITRVVADAGIGDDVIDARSLTVAVVDFTGGDGNDTLIAGAGSLVSASNRNILRGGTGNDKLYGSSTYDSLYGDAGNDLLIAYGAPDINGNVAFPVDYSKDQDILYGGTGTDILDGGMNTDRYVFENDFGRDRIVEQDDTTTNDLDFSAVSTTLELNLGRILYSAASGSNYAFADPGLFDSVKTGSGNDRINTTWFFPDLTLTLDGGNGADTYAVTLGDNEAGGLAPGRINIVDSGSSGSDLLLLLPTRADEFEASTTRVRNGRERMDNSGIDDMIIDAGSFTVRLGNLGDPDSWADIGNESIVYAGRVKMVSHLEGGNISWYLKNGMQVDRHLNARDDGDISIVLQNPDPSALIEFSLNGGSSTFQPRITTSTRSVFDGAPALTIPATTPSAIDYIYNGPTASLAGVPVLTTGMSLSSISVPGLGGIVIPERDGLAGYPAFTLTGRSQLTLAGDGHVVPSQPDYVHASTEGRLATPEETVPAAAAYTVPAWSGTLAEFGYSSVLLSLLGLTGTESVTRAAVTIPGRDSYVIPATSAILPNGTQGNLIAPENVDGDGSGTIYLANFNGSILNLSAADALPAVIEAGAGSIQLKTSFNIGLPGTQATDRIVVRTATLAAQTIDAVIGGSIYIRSLDDLTLGTVGSMQGVTTQRGDIDIELVAGKRLYAESINAGGPGGAAGGNIVLSADEIDLQNRTVAVSPILGLVTRTIEIPNYSFDSGSFSFYYDPIFINYTEEAIIGWSTAVTDVTPIEGVTLTMGNAYKTASRPSRLSPYVVSDATRVMPIRVASTTDTPDVLDITLDDLAALKDGFDLITIGRADAFASPITLYGATFNDSVKLRGSQLNVPASAGNITVVGTLSAQIVDPVLSGNGSVLIEDAGVSNPLFADSIDIAAVNNIVLSRVIDLGSRPDRTIALTAGSDGTGNLTVNSLISAIGTGASLTAIAGSAAAGGSGVITINNDVVIGALIDLSAPADTGTITVTSPYRLTSELLLAESGAAMVLRSATERVRAAVQTAGAMVINELDDIQLIKLTNEDGTIAVTAGGYIEQGQLSPIAPAAHPDAPTDVMALSSTDASGKSDITLVAGGASTSGEAVFHTSGRIIGRRLTVSGPGSIDLYTEVDTLDAHATATGDINILEADVRAPFDRGGLTLENVRTADGSIEVTANGDILVNQARTLTDADDNDITLRVNAAQGGKISYGTIHAGLLGDVELISDSIIEAFLTGLITADELIARSQGGQVLQTNVAKLKAVSNFVAGDILINEANALQLIDLDKPAIPPALYDAFAIKSFDGVITVNTQGSLDIADDVQAPLTQDVFIHAGLSGAGAITWSADPGEGNVIGDDLFFTAAGSMTIRTNGVSIDAQTSKAGNIDLVEVDSVLLERVISADGDLLIQVGSSGVGGSATLNTLTAGNDHDIRMEDVWGDILHPTGKVTANTVTANAHGNMTLLTNIAILDASVITTAGFIDITEDDGIELRDVDTFNGPISVLAIAGDVTATDVVSTADDDLNDIEIRAALGNIFVNWISAGTAHGDLFLTADIGSIEEVNPEDANDGFYTPELVGLDLVADHAVLNAFGGIGALRPIETRFNTLEAHVTSAGNLDLNEYDQITLVDIDTADGSITFDAGGTVTAEHVESLTDADANDISIHTAMGDIQADWISAGITNGDLFLTSDAGSIEEVDPQDVPDTFLSPATGGLDLVADNAILTASGSIGGLRPLEIRFNTLTAESFGTGGIGLNAFDAIDLERIYTNNGPITIGAGGTIRAFDVRSFTDSDSNDISLSALRGDLLVDLVIAGGAQLSGNSPSNAADIELSSAGAILEMNSDAAIDLRADGLTMTAVTGIGVGDPLEIAVRGLSATTTNGDIRFNSLSGQAVQVETLQTGLGDVFFDQVNGGDLTIDLLSVDRGNIELLSQRSGSLTLRSALIGTGDLTILNTGGSLELTAASIGSGNMLLTNTGGALTVTDGRIGSGDMVLTNRGGALNLVSGRIRSGVMDVTNSGGNLFVGLAQVGRGDINLIAMNSRLIISQLSVGGNALFQADELDLIGGTASVIVSDTLHIKPYDPSVIIFINEFGELFDVGGQLEFDRSMFLAVVFGSLKFSGLTAIFYPDFGTLPSSAPLSAPREDGAGDMDLSSLLFFGSAYSDGPHSVGFQSLSHLFAQTEIHALHAQLPYSPQSIFGMEPGLRELFGSATLDQAQLLSLFRLFFGYSFYALDGLALTLFENLPFDDTQSNAVTTSETRLEHHVVVATETDDLLDGEPQAVLVAADDPLLPEEVGENESDFSLAGAVSMLPLMFMGLSARVAQWRKSS